MGRDLASLSLLGAVLMTASCASAGVADPLVLYTAGPEARQAQLQGRLQLEGACLYIVSGEGERWLAAFPSPGTRWEPGESVVQVGARSLRVGEMGAFGGGEVSNAAGAVPWVRAPADSCDASKVWMVSTLMDP